MSRERRLQHAESLGSLAFAAVAAHAPALAARSLRWHRDLATLGVSAPLCVVHDLGLTLAAPPERLAPVDGTGRLPRRAGSDFPSRESLDAYRSLVGEFSATATAQAAAKLQLGDDVVVAVLARLLRRVGAETPAVALAPLEPDLLEGLEPTLPELAAAVGRQAEATFLRRLVADRLHLLTLTDAIDVDALRLIGRLDDPTHAGALRQVDVLSVLDTPEASDVVDFSLQLLPSVLEARRRAGAGTHAAHGWAGLSRKGSVDSLVASELAWDDEEFTRRLLDEELLFHAREQTREETRGRHLLLVDASASMRGQRATFARGIAIATARQLLLRGDDVQFHFFDARLYEGHGARRGQLPVSLLLAFQGERGRHPARVFEDLVRRLENLGGRDPRIPTVHVFTHAALHIPRELVARLRERARLTVVFMVPSGGALDLDYLDLLHRYWVVDHETLRHQTGRAAEAKRILEEAPS